MTVRIRGNTRIKSQTLVGFPPQPALNLNFTQGYANGLNPLPSTVTFTRADSAAVATQVGPDGLVRLAAHNFVPSSTYVTPSGTTNATVTPNNTTAPDGTITAALFNDGPAPGIHQTFFQITSGPTLTVPYTATVYAKAGTGRYATLSNLDFGASYGAYAVFDLATGLITQSGSLGAGTLVSTGCVPAGNGWWRLQVTASMTSAGGRVHVFSSASAATYTPDSAGRNTYTGASNTYFIWGAQLEQNITPSYYVPTTTAAKYADTPRFDYSPVTTEPLGLLIEEERRNTITNSNTFTSGAGWNLSNTATVISTATSSPDGSASAYLLYPTSTGSFRIVSKQITAASAVFTTSFYAKAQNKIWVAVLEANGNNNAAYFNLSTGQKGTVLPGYTADIIPAGGGWYRCIVTHAATANPFIYFGPVDANGSAAVTANGTDGIYIYGAQLEAGSFPTSYIPTTSAAVTRAADLAKMTGTNFSSWYTQTGGTFLTVSDTVDPRTSGSPQFFGTAHVFALYSTTANFYDVRNTATTGSVGMATGSESATSSDFLFIYNGLAANSQVRQALAVKTNDVAFTYNGGSVSTDTSFALPSSMTTFNIGSSRVDAGWTNGHIAKIQYWPARFSNAQLQLITKV